MKQKLIFFDLEATGFRRQPHNCDQIVQFAASHFENNDNDFAIYLKVDYLPIAIVELTKIDPKWLNNNGIDYHQGLVQINHWINQNANATWIGHNTHNYDWPLLFSNLKDAGLINDPTWKDWLKRLKIETIDLLYLAKQKLPGLDSYRLENLANHLQIDLTNAHNAIADVEITKAVYQKLTGI